MEDKILNTIKDLGYKGAANDKNDFLKAIQEGAKSPEYTNIVAYLTSELKALDKIDEEVNAITNPEDSISFLMELSSFLKELRCPYVSLTQGHVSDRLESVPDKLLLLEYLCRELMAARMLRAKRPEKKFELKLQETPEGADLRMICTTFRFPKPPANITLEQLFKTITVAAEKAVQRAGNDLLGKPIFSGHLSDKQWNTLENVQKDLSNEYTIRREMLLKRLDCTIQSFEWSDKLKGKAQKIEEIYAQKRKLLKVEPGIDLSDLLSARDDIAIIEKTSNANVRKNTKSDINKVIIGQVPDRGGRPSEQAPPPPEMPSWQQRSTGPSGRGGRGGANRGGYGDTNRVGRGGGYNRGGGGGNNQQNRASSGGYDQQKGNSGGYNQQKGNSGGYNQQKGNSGGYNQQSWGNSGGFGQDKGNSGGFGQDKGNSGGYDYNQQRRGSGGGYDQQNRKSGGYEYDQQNKYSSTGGNSGSFGQDKGNSKGYDYNQQRRGSGGGYDQQNRKSGGYEYDQQNKGSIGGYSQQNRGSSGSYDQQSRGNSGGYDQQNRGSYSSYDQQQTQSRSFDSAGYYGSSSSTNTSASNYGQGGSYGGFDSAGSYGGYKKSDQGRDQVYNEPKRAKTYESFQNERTTYADLYVQESQHNQQYHPKGRGGGGRGRSSYNRGGGYSHR